jgi:hypothetical protein
MGFYNVGLHTRTRKEALRLQQLFTVLGGVLLLCKCQKSRVGPVKQTLI